MGKKHMRPVGNIWETQGGVQMGKKNGATMEDKEQGDHNNFLKTKNNDIKRGREREGGRERERERE